MGTVAADVWSVATRTLTGVGSSGLATQTDINNASTSIVALVNSNTDAQILNASSSINANTNAQATITNTKVENASSSLGATALAIKAKTDAINWSDISNLPANVATSVWASGTRTLTSMGTVAADVWSVATRTLTSLTLSSQSPWTVNVSDFGTINNGSTYMATLTTIYNGTLTDSSNVPTVTVYDPNRNVVANNVTMTRTAAGTYSYSYTTASNAPAGVWESVFSANVETGKTLPGNDYWNVVSSPAQVIINSVSGTVPNAIANLTITNEGLAGYEYQYEWCVVSDQNNSCGGGDDIFHGTGAKFINPGEDWNTNLTATVPTAGNYYFKALVHFGIETSGSSRSFTISNSKPPSGGGGGGGGGGNIPKNTSDNLTCSGADFNHDKKVNSIDFSILLAFWKTSPPFKNNCVDINKDKQVNSVDFSILLSQWGTKGKAL